MQRGIDARSARTTIGMTALVALALTSGAPIAASAQGAQDAGASGLPACVAVRTEARYVPYGYNHVVIITNGCSKTASCRVATDVNPDPTVVEVRSSETVEVLTFTASPAQSFTARVSCALR